MKNLTQAGIVAPAKILPKRLPSAEWAAMGPQARREYAATMSRRYRSARAKLERGRLLDEFTAMTGAASQVCNRALGQTRPDAQGAPSTAQQLSFRW